MTEPNQAAVGVEICGVNLSYGSNHVLHDVNLTIAPGEFFAFLGPSGCGKTTLLRLLAGFNAAQSGKVLVGGRDISSLPPWARDVGMVFQSYALWPHLSVRRNVAFGLEERRLPRRQINQRVDAALDLVGLSAYGERKPSQLSGGQQQRVALARTIIIEPKVLLLDEPLSNLDAKMRVQVRHELRDLQQRLGITTIFVTHDQEEANAICDRIAVMNEGVVQQVGTPMELYAHPSNLFVANFLGTANVVSGQFTTQDGVRRFNIGGGLALPVPDSVGADEVKFIFRPQEALLGSTSGEAIQLPAKTLSREFLGSHMRYRLQVGEAEISVDTPFNPQMVSLEPGQPTSVSLLRNAGCWLVV